jgi:hypothetical protein
MLTIKHLLEDGLEWVNNMGLDGLFESRYCAGPIHKGRAEGQRKGQVFSRRRLLHKDGINETAGRHG